MRRYAAIAARFTLFHFLSVLATALIAAVAIEIRPSLAGTTIRLQPPPVEFALRLTVVLGPFLLVPSAIGWWLARIATGRLGIAAGARPALQGATAGLASFLAFCAALAMVPPNLLGLPIGAFIGWLIYRRVWPNLPEAAPERTVS